jgi:hypothetical protein
VVGAVWSQLSLTRLDMAVHELSRPRGASLKMKDSGSQTSGTQQQVDPVWRYAKELLLEAEADALRSSQIRETCFGRNHPMVANAQVGKPCTCRGTYTLQA